MPHIVVFLQFLQDESCEDQHSIGQHMQTMLKEMERARPNVDLLKDLLQRSQSTHKQLLETLSTPAVLEKCPYFKLPAMVNICLQNSDFWAKC